MNRRLFATLTAVMGLAATSLAHGDVFVLQSGGRVEGALLNPGEEPRQKYDVQLPGGGTLSLAADQVQEHKPVRDDEDEYARIRPGYADTVEGQWALAEWCRTRKMLDERDVHLERIIELDPDHQQARYALHYTKIDGKWLRRNDAMAERGMTLYKGRYRTQQEIELMEGKRKQELNEKDWFQKITRWRGWLLTERAAIARESLLGIEDPAAIRPLIHGLQTDRAADVRTFFAEVLARFNAPECTRALAAAAMEDPVEEVRLQCIDHLKKRPAADSVSYFCGQLKSKDNQMVLRAGIALGRLGDPSAIAPLIDALVTTHKYKVQSSKPGQTTTGFSPSGAPGGFNFGSSTKIMIEQRHNQTVLDALVAMTRQNFGFDQREWRKWFAMQKQRETLDPRRE